MVQAFFTRPGEFNDIHEKLLADIKGCKRRLLVSVAYFSEKSIVKAIIDKYKAGEVEVRVIINAPDKHRRFSLAPLLIDSCPTVALGTWITDENQSNMHHKFLICDDVLWTGSYNITPYAMKNNWENMLRIVDKTVVDKFKYEFEYMWIVGNAVNSLLDKGKCTKCKKTVSDPLSHFQVVVDAGQPMSNGWPIFSTYCENSYAKEPFETKCDFCGKKILSTESITSNTTSYLAVYCLGCAYELIWSPTEKEDYE